ncbi:F-box only protein 43 [Anolis carolinensis]|uniref:F-box only protein 43 n=1 Tax=Anolis carolinensis TaxID=28377 RepID=UPI0002C885FA|nr:PREDICTED: F-box only protein 43 [Anolis carolinensis]|eukprot:XP_003226654.2 PREDICTED: F-box only protein 43 [Anolis carolinensis]
MCWLLYKSTSSSKHKMSESNSILSNIFKRVRLPSPGNNTSYFSFKDPGSPSIFYDSGYNESLKDQSFNYAEAEHKREQNDRGLPEYSKHAHPSSLCASVSSSIENKHNTTLLSGRKEASIHTDYSETPRIAKKELSIRRRLLVSKAASAGALGCSERQLSPSGNSCKKTCSSLFHSFDERISKSALDSPRDKSYQPLATSTLKSEDTISGSQRLRLAFSQQRTSTIDDSKPKGNLLSEPSLSPIQPQFSADTHSCFFDSALQSINDKNTCSKLVGTPQCRLPRTNDDKSITPINSIVEGFHLTIAEITTPPVTEIGNLSLLTPDSISYKALSCDKSEDSSSEHDGSFQELRKCSEPSSTVKSKRKLRKLQRSRRLSTLSERGSQSEKEENDSTFSNSKCDLKISAGCSNEDSDLVFSANDNRCMVPNPENLSRTPALQLIHTLFMQNRSKKKEESDLLNNTGGLDISLLKCVVAQLIGKKMGIKKLDILTELRDRHLKHVLTMILDILTVESLCSMWNVCQNWREIIVLDKQANRRRKFYIKQLRAATKRNIANAEDAATRLMMTRLALRPVQAQGKSPALKTQPVLNKSLTPQGCSSILQSTSKHEAYVKVAQTLFTGEALKPCPKCQSPAKYESFKKRGLCSREDCAFDFCSLCLCDFHGSRDCSTSSWKWQNTKYALPGSAKSKRNLKRL